MLNMYYFIMNPEKAVYFKDVFPNRALYSIIEISMQLLFVKDMNKQSSL